MDLQALFFTKKRDAYLTIPSSLPYWRNCRNPGKENGNGNSKYYYTPYRANHFGMVSKRPNKDFGKRHCLTEKHTSTVSQKFYARFWQFNISINQSNHIHKIRISKTEIPGPDLDYMGTKVIWACRARAGRNKSEIRMLKCPKHQPKPDDTEALHPILTD